MKRIFIVLISLGFLGNINAQDQSLQEQIDNIYDNMAKDMSNRWRFKGDLRFRNENIEQELALDRNRNRIRARVGAVATVNDTVKAEVQFATGEGGDARSTNQTLGDGNSRKALDLDLAYAEWSPNTSAKITLGKMKQPLATTTSFMVDKDITPEGFAVNYTHAPTGIFANAAMFDLAERGSAADSTAIALQAGLRGKVNSDTSYTLALTHMDHRDVQNHALAQSGTTGGFFGNTTKIVGCLSKTTAGECMAYEYTVNSAFVEVNTVLESYPLQVFAEAAQNSQAPALNQALALGATLGRASLPGSWEMGVVYQNVEKDALFAQWIDSDFAGGSTDGRGYVVRGAYQAARNWRINVTYYDNELNNDVPVLISGKPLQDREYRRLQVDFNFSF